MSRRCRHCGKVFEPRHKKHRYCRQKCCQLAFYAAHRDEIAKRVAAYRATHPGHAAAYNSANAEKIAKRKAVYYLANRRRILKQQAAYRAAHPEISAAYRLAHRDEWAEYHAAYRAKHRKRYAAYRAAHRGKMAKYQAVYRAANKEKIAKRKAAYRAAHRKPKVLKNEKGKPEASIRQAKPVAGIATLDAALKPI